MALSEFGRAFSAARKAGKKTFQFKGKAYNTKLASDTKQSANVPTPKPRPRRGAYEGASSDDVAKATARPTATNSGQERKASRTRGTIASGETSSPSRIEAQVRRRDNQRPVRKGAGGSDSDMKMGRTNTQMYSQAEKRRLERMRRRMTLADGEMRR